jgi:hypothetical protein
MLAVALASSARAQDETTQLPQNLTIAPSASVAPASSSTLPEAPPEAPPPLPRHKGLVLDASLGALGFGGQFRHVAPPGPWVHAQLGYEVFDWLMLFGEGEIMFTDTSEAQDPSKSLAFDIWGFGGGVRGTVRPWDRVGFYLQGSIDAMRADIQRNGLVILGFRDAESLQPSFGGRFGVEWYQIDRHLALGLGVGVRDAQGFAKLAAKSDTGLMWDASASIRYTF